MVNVYNVKSDGETLYKRKESERLAKRKMHSPAAKLASAIFMVFLISFLIIS